MEESSPFLRDGSDEEEEISTSLYNFGRDRTGGSSGKKVTSRRCCLAILIVSAIILVLVLFGSGILMGYYALPGRYGKGCNGGGGGNSNSSTGNNTKEICASPPLLLISLDGFRESYFKLGVTPTLEMLASGGVRSKFMRSSFPTVTFSNHFSIVTGLYPESHGIVGNYFYDSVLNDSFNMFTPGRFESKWWKGEPIWVTAVKNKLRTASYFWPGSPAVIQGIQPTYYKTYELGIPFSLGVEQVMDWLDLPKKDRPQFIALYSDNPDETGHKYGPDSPQMTSALSELDGNLRLLVFELEKRKILDCVNIMVVSDHGMDQYNSSLLVNIDQFIPPSLRKTIKYFPLETISIIEVPGDEKVVQQVYEGLAEGPAQGLPYRVFPSDRLPLRFHAGVQNKQRYGQLYAIADLHGYMINNDSKAPPLGNHGFDNLEANMHAIFIGHGPYFKKNYTADPFENIHLYSLMCDLLNITESRNNGSYGALHHILDPTFASNQPLPRSMTPLPGTLSNCTFPLEQKELRRRSLCDDCVCRTESACNNTDEDILEANEYLFNMSAELKHLYRAYHHPWGAPRGGSGDGACPLYQQDYVSLYSHTLNIPLWAGYTLKPSLVDGNVSEDHWCWRNDPRLPLSGAPNCSTDLRLDQSNSTLIPTPLLFPMDSSVNTSLSMSVRTNMVYMDRDFRDGLWLLVMSRIGAWFWMYKTPMNIITGVVLDSNRDGVRDHDSDYANKFMGVAIPTHFYVVITRCSVSGVSLSSCSVRDLRVLGLVLQHPKEPGDYMDDERVLQYSVTPVRDIERATGVDFFPNLSPADQNMLELSLLDEPWMFTAE